ncbi:MAG: hypothetical protein IKI03_02390 [Clostridia bacterium]|nr:hypothetical protein [Clostridia bacterium]
MKPASIIVLIIAALLVICGVVLCLIGSSAAKKDGMDLFPQIKDGQPYIKQEFSPDKISKIELSISNATINVTGGEINSYIEFINYNPNLYDLDVTSQAISFSESENLRSLFNIWENGFGFKGYRNFLNPRSLKANGDKSINIHLGDSSLISSVSIKGKNVVLIVNNVQIKKEIKINADSLKIDASGLTAGSGIYLYSSSFDGKFESVACGLLKSETDSAKISSQSSDIRQIDLRTESGVIDIENIFRGDGEAEFDISTKSGTITVDGEKIDGLNYSVKSSADEIQFSYKIKTGTANVNYTNRIEETPETEDTSETENVGG